MNQQSSEIKRLAYELTYHSHLLNREKARGLFTELEISEYIPLHGIAYVASASPEPSERAYLTDLSQHLKIPLSSLSAMAAKLKDKGLVRWSHEGRGDEGTFLVITDAGKAAMQRQEEKLADYYSRVIDRFGKEQLMEFLAQLRTLEDIMDEESALQEGAANGSESAE